MGKVVSIMSFNSAMEAGLYKALLESAGIEVWLQNDLALQVLSIYGGLMQVNLLVSEEDAARAREVLGAKFDIDEFQRLSGAPEKPAAKRRTRKSDDSPASPAKPAAARKTAVRPAAKSADASNAGTKSAPAAASKTGRASAAKKPAAGRKAKKVEDI